MDENPTDTEEDEECVSRLAGGFNILVRDFDRALVAARLEWGHYLLIQQAREESWAASQIDRSGQPKPFLLNVSRIARNLDIDRSSLAERHIELVKAAIFLKQDDGTFLINKDYRTWIKWSSKDRSALLTGRRIKWSKQIRRKVRSVGSNLQKVLVPTYSEGQSLSPDCRLEPTTAVGSNLQAARLEPTVPYNRNTDVNSLSDNGLERKSGVASIGTGAESIQRERESNSLSLLTGGTTGRARDFASPDETDTFAPVVYRSDPEEPFAGIEDVPPPAITLTPEEARLKASVEKATLKATSKPTMPGGNPEAAEAMSDWAIDHLRDGAKISAIRDSISKACRKLAGGGMDWGSAPSYAETCLRGWKSDPGVKSQGDAWKAAPPKKTVFHTAAPRPRPATDTQKGA